MIFFLLTPFAYLFCFVLKGTFWENFKKAVNRSWPIGFLVREVSEKEKERKRGMEKEKEKKGF